MLLPLWARGKSNKIALMGVWRFGAHRVGFADRHWWALVEMWMELDPPSAAWQRHQSGTLMLSTADVERMSSSERTKKPRP